MEVSEEKKKRKRKKEFSTLLLKANPIRLVIGPSNVFQKGWVESNIEYLNILNLSNWVRYFKEESVTYMLAEHVWENLTLADAFYPDKEYIKGQKVEGRYIRVNYLNNLMKIKNFIHMNG
jgi:predicted SAM-dependent methyltransferase